jgi:3-phosphoshikimate 1-carboxyvinyltransferase
MRRVRYEVRPTGYAAADYEVEPDASAASYFLAAAAMMPDARCTIEGLGFNALQGDARFVEVLEKMGALVDAQADRTRVIGPERLRGVDVPLNDMPDMAQTLAAVAVFAEGSTVIRDVGNLRVKETDRLAALEAELTKLGARVTIKGDDLRIEPPPGNTPRHPDGRPISDDRPVEIDTYDDHRMAMSMALVGLRCPGVRIKDPACVGKTYPGFFDDLAALPAGGRVRAGTGHG